MFLLVWPFYSAAPTVSGTLSRSLSLLSAGADIGSRRACSQHCNSCHRWNEGNGHKGCRIHQAYHRSLVRPIIMLCQCMSRSRSGEAREVLGGPLLYCIVLFSATLFGWRSSTAAVLAIAQMAVSARHTTILCENYSHGCIRSGTDLPTLLGAKRSLPRLLKLLFRRRYGKQYKWPYVTPRLIMLLNHRRVDLRPRSTLSHGSVRLFETLPSQILRWFACFCARSDNRHARPAAMVIYPVKSNIETKTHRFEYWNCLTLSFDWPTLLIRVVRSPCPSWFKNSDTPPNH